jgi:5-methyltetrahydropteroyltriglutamate--homocysteine methyltransferase
MRRSTDRILTTHTGSLPRPPELLAELLRRDPGEPVDADALGARVREAVADVVRRQAEAGVAVVNDGEAGKIGYSTYVTQRLEGFGGEADPPGPPPDMLEFPEYHARVSGDPSAEPAMPACDGPIAYRDTAAVRADIANLRAALDGAGAEDAFLSAASPGVVRSSWPTGTTATTRRTCSRSPTR